MSDSEFNFFSDSTKCSVLVLTYHGVDMLRIEGDLTTYSRGVLITEPEDFKSALLEWAAMMLKQWEPVK